MDYSNLPRHDVLCIDMKSFYASCESVLLGLDPEKTKLAVVGDINRNGSVVLASSPLMKKLYGIKTGSRLYEIKKINDPEIIIRQSRMKDYLKMSQKIRSIFETFVPPEAIHTYSVDESWLTLDGTEKLWGTPFEAAKKIIDIIKEETGLIATVGIGDNKFLAKAVLDNFGKEKGIAECRYEMVETMLHPLKVEKMFGVGAAMKKHFNDMSIFTIGDLAHSDVDLLEQIFGINGRKLYLNAWGIDFSPVIYDKDNIPQNAFGFAQIGPETKVKSIGRGITLLKDYTKEEDILLVMKEIAEEVCVELRKKRVEGKTIHLSIDYSNTAGAGGFSRQKTIALATNDRNEVMDVCKELFYKFYEKNKAVRKIRISVGKLTKEVVKEDLPKQKKLNYVKDLINEKFGKGTIIHASSLKKEAVAKERAKKIGGHFE